MPTDILTDQKWFVHSFLKTLSSVLPSHKRSYVLLQTVLDGFAVIGKPFLDDDVSAFIAVRISYLPDVLREALLLYLLC
jgi:hypothetical protein